MSARFIMAVSIISTLCILVLFLAAMATIKVISAEVFLASLSPFVLIAREISDAYFKRDDRQQTKEAGK